MGLDKLWASESCESCESSCEPCETDVSSQSIFLSSAFGYLAQVFAILALLSISFCYLPSSFSTFVKVSFFFFFFFLFLRKFSCNSWSCWNQAPSSWLKKSRGGSHCSWSGRKRAKWTPWRSRCMHFCSSVYSRKCRVIDWEVRFFNWWRSCSLLSYRG